MLAFGPYRLDRRRGQLWCGSEPVPLRPKAWEVLLYLADRPGSLVPNDEIQHFAWPETAITPKTLTNVIGELRRALGDNAEHPVYIETVHRRGYRFIGPLRQGVQVESAAAKTPAAVTQRPHPRTLVGRTSEFRALTAAWEAVLAGERHVAFIIGEAGIGKSVLLDTFLRSIREADGEALIGRAHCIERHGAHEAYMPLLDIVGEWAAEDQTGLVIDLLNRYAPTWLAQIPWLQTPDQRDDLERTLRASGTGRMLREGARFLEVLADHRPIVLALEDLHWCDPATVDFLGALEPRSRQRRLMIVGTYRPIDARLSAHPVTAVASALVRGGARSIVLEAFSQSEIASFLQLKLDAQISADLVSQVEAHSRGIPLFVRAVADQMAARQLTDAVTSGERFIGTADQPHGVSLPEGVREAIDAQIALLPAGTIDVVEVAAVAGDQFSIEAVAQALGEAPEHVEAALTQLIRNDWLIREISSRRSDDRSGKASHEFVHDLYHRAVYDRVPEIRRQRLHQRIGEYLESFGPTGREAELASHFERSGDHVRATHYLEGAAHSVSRRCASREAVHYLQRAIAEIRKLPHAQDRARDELRLLISLGESATHAFGPDHELVSGSVRRSMMLLPETRDTETVANALHGLWLYSLLGGDYTRVAQVLIQTQELSARAPDARLQLLADFMTGTVMCFTGAATLGRQHLETAWRGASQLSLHNSGIDVQVEIEAALAWSMWLTGEPDSAMQHALAAAALAADRQDPNSCAFSLIFLFNICLLRGDFEEALAHARELSALGDEFDLDLSRQTGALLEAAAHMELGDFDAAVNHAGRSGTSEAASGLQQVVRTFYLGRVALAAARAGFPRQGLDLVSDALGRIASNGLATSQAEILRIRGELVQLVDQATIIELGLATGAAADPLRLADECFAEAINIAEVQGTKAWQLRASVSRARLWRRQGRGVEAHQLLSGIYRQFTEGFETGDLREAAALLRELTPNTVPAAPGIN